MTLLSLKAPSSVLKQRKTRYLYGRTHISIPLYQDSACSKNIIALSEDSANHVLDLSADFPVSPPLTCSSHNSPWSHTMFGISVFQHFSVPQWGKERKHDWETEHFGSSPASSFYSSLLSAWTHPGHLFLDHCALICGKPTSSPPPPLSVIDPGQLGICFSSVPLGMWGWERRLQQNV